jgi:type II secretory pathway pseudopilin PulG
MQAGSRQSGFTYVALLFALTVFALGAASLGEVTSRSVQRDRERELIEIGLRIQDAIGSYYMASPGSTKEFPTSFADLEFDARYVGVKRHLRRLERDPLTAQFDWGFIRGADGGIAGVFSTSGKTPLAVPGAEIHGYLIPPGGRYPDWKFSFVPPKTP